MCFYRSLIIGHIGTSVFFHGFDLFCIQEAEAMLREMEGKLEDLQSVSDSVAEYFCEDPLAFKLDECCSIFNSFSERFLRAMQVKLHFCKV